MTETLANLGIVAIGRNEGKRLEACLTSILSQARPVVYVDSGSSDSSVAFARSVGVEVVELDMSKPFSAARARNEGFKRIMKLDTSLSYVQFLDGDCLLVKGWLKQAGRFLEANSEYAIVCGRRRERFPATSVYNRLIDLEWDTPIGEAMACGGDALVRVSAFSQIKGFDPTVVAGEEPELCVRLRAAGWRVMRLDAEMTMHDAAMTRVGQWWKRAVRGGYGGLDVASRCKQHARTFSRQIRSARLWGLGWPLVTLFVTGAAFALYGWQASAFAAIVLLVVLPLQIIRVSLKSLRRCGNFRTAFFYGMLMMLEKWANLRGQYLYMRDRRTGRLLSIIEYKPAGGSTGSID